jgi:flagellin-like hook-associated protein FlgL
MLGQVRTRLGVDLGKLQDSEVALQMQETDINTRKAHVEDANLAEAITLLNQTQTALEATLKAGSLVRQLNLFDYLG